MQGKFAIGIHDGMTGIRTSLKSDDNICRIR